MINVIKLKYSVLVKVQVKLYVNNILNINHNELHIYCKGGEICTQIAINSKIFQLSGLIGFIGIEGIYNLTKFYAGPKDKDGNVRLKKHSVVMEQIGVIMVIMHVIH